MVAQVEEKNFFRWLFRTGEPFGIDLGSKKDYIKEESHIQMAIRLFHPGPISINSIDKEFMALAYHLRTDKLQQAGNNQIHLVKLISKIVLAGNKVKYVTSLRRKATPEEIAFADVMNLDIQEFWLLEKEEYCDIHC